MLSRLGCITRNMRLGTKVNCFAGVRAYGGGGDDKSLTELAIENKCTYNHLPVPEGSWEEGYKKDQQRIHRNLLGQLAFFGLTVFMMAQYDCISDMRTHKFDKDVKLIGEVDATKSLVDNYNG